MITDLYVYTKRPEMNDAFIKLAKDVGKCGKVFEFLNRIQIGDEWTIQFAYRHRLDCIRGMSFDKIHIIDPKGLISEEVRNEIMAQQKPGEGDE